ncbi:MAG: potassium-transporting ATPase subunit F [Patulibacter sp.]
MSASALLSLAAVLAVGAYLLIALLRAERL